MKWAPLIVSGILAFGGLAAAERPQVTRISQFSGKAVPRFETLKFAAVNGRSGPSREHPVVWRYERKGLPLLIIKESQDWRRVRDPSGDEVWVHARMLEAGAAAMLQSATMLHEAPDAASPVVASLEAGVLVELGACRVAWCALEVQGFDGWAPRETLWGADTGEAGL
ncbi:SH3 domain-containing protein [Hyphomonas sp.]|uniref:SH3 domain-containing protein n=1 Tax=Hyphomonas sp. TaxID=87 RepID=UPI0032EAA32B|tara:strand:- start:8999 stop:9502 length:504 start_codon:yes stop_codon:yes gene_type:complete